MRARALTVLLAAALLAGCVGDAAPEADTPTADTLEDVREESAEPAATTPADLTGGHAPHVHNYWGESDRVVLYQGAVPVQILSDGTFYNVFLRKDPSLGGTFWELPEGATVYEGTGVLEITASWTASTITGLGAAFKTPNEPLTRDTFADVTPLVNGQTLQVQVTPEMTDMPHDAVSRWIFYFPATGTPGVAEGEFDLKIEIVRMRDVMQFPGHPDTYEDTDRYVLADKDFTYRNPSFASFFVELLTDQRRDPIVPDKPVPMETRVLVVEMTIASATAAAPATAIERYDLVYRSADGGRYVAQLLEAADPKYVWGLPVDDHQVDSPYGDHSAWRFAPIARSTVGGVSCDFCVEIEVSGRVVITAYAEDPTGEIKREAPPI